MGKTKRNERGAIRKLQSSNQVFTPADGFSKKYITRRSVSNAARARLFESSDEEPEGIVSAVADDPGQVSADEPGLVSTDEDEPEIVNCAELEVVSTADNEPEIVFPVADDPDQLSSDDDQPIVKLKPKFSQAEANRQWVVKQVCNVRIRKGVRQTLIQWKKYPVKTWNNFVDGSCRRKVLECLEKQYKKQGSRLQKKKLMWLKELRKQSAEHDANPDAEYEDYDPKAILNTFGSIGSKANRLARAKRAKAAMSS